MNAAASQEAEPPPASSTVCLLCRVLLCLLVCLLVCLLAFSRVGFTLQGRCCFPVRAGRIIYTTRFLWFELSLLCDVSPARIADSTQHSECQTAAAMK